MPFIQDDFLLDNDPARRLFGDYAIAPPIIDYHNHLPPVDLAGDRTFGNLFEAWLEGDHYKWRAMRAAGIDETYVTGDADPRDKFLAYAKTVPQTLRNPLYHWTHLELVRYFGIDLPLNEQTADEIWTEANRQLQAMPVSAMLDKFNVALLGTTDDPTDTLEHHRELVGSDALPNTVVVPTFRPDKAYQTQDLKAWNKWVTALGKAAGTKCGSLNSFMSALHTRHRFFHDLGGRVSDHGLTHLPVAPCSEKSAKAIFKKAREGSKLTQTEQDKLLVFLMLELGAMDADAGWTKQLHLGAIRNNNGWAMKNLGPDTGFDSIGDFTQGPGLSGYLGELAAREKLPRTILYNLNPSDNYLFATMAGNFNGGPPGSPSQPGKMQFGTGWWFLDQEQGMRMQMDALSNLGLLPRFVGMLTDSRSFLSFPRHEYFRRTLCNLLGQDIQSGRLPADYELLGQVVQDVCFNNAKNYFGLPLKGRHA